MFVEIATKNLNAHEIEVAAVEGFEGRFQTLKSASGS